MLIDPQDGRQFFRLHWTLLAFVNQRLKVIHAELSTPQEIAALPAGPRTKIRDALYANLNLIEAFVAENPAHLPEDELAIVRSWRHLVTGEFVIFRELKKYTVFLSKTDPVIAYGVLELSQTLEEIIGQQPPILVVTTLLPFKDKIIYDGFINPYRISFGSNTRRSFNEHFQAAKLRHGIVTSLPMSNEPLPPRPSKPKPAPKPPAKEDKEESLAVIIELIDRFCKAHLNEEYAAMCRKMAEKLGRKRPSPFHSGGPNAWASGIVRAVGRVNFLQDKTQPLYMKATDIDHHLGTSPSSGAAKYAAIKKMLKLRVFDPSWLRLRAFDPDWTLPSLMAKNPLVWMLRVNGITMDIRTAPREAQEIAFEKGLIPYIPADREQGKS